MRSLSLFSGCLGLDLGLEKAGIKTIAFVDKDKKCRDTILANRPRAKVFNDVFDPEVVKFCKGKVDVVVGGPPCQSFSTIGKRRFLEDERGKAVLGFVNVVEHIRPKFFVFENVRGFASKKTAWIVDQLEDRFHKLGYSTEWQILNAVDFGVPQARKRFIMIGKRGKGKVKMPIPTARKVRTLRMAIGDIEGYQESGRFSPLMHRVMEQIPEDGNWKSLPKREQKKAMGKADLKSGGLTAFYRRLSMDKPSPTLLCSPSQRATTLCHPTETRPLSVAEYKRIQGFPDNWKVTGSITDKYRQLGNAVPILLGKAIGKAIMKMT